jgi:membrane dipeptidase
MESGCCGCLGVAGRRAFLVSLASVVASACAGPTREAATRRERDLAAQASTVPVFDLHAHPGAFTRAATGSLPTGALDEMVAGGVDAAFFAAVSDGPVIRREPNGIRNFRDPAPGELHRNTLAQLARVRARVDEGRVHLLRRPADLKVARARGARAALMALEGGDALEGRVERVRELHALGVRSIQLVHYRINELGDIQTEPALHGGLTAFGKDVVREMNRLGMVVDVAHATLAGVKAAVDVAQKPMILSHTILFTRTQLARAITREHGQLVARPGGVIGVFPIATDAFNFNGFIDHVSRLVDAVGVDHVGIGTDMDGIPSGPVFSDYAEWPSIPAALLARGYRPDDVVKVMGGNFARVLKAVAPA